MILTYKFRIKDATSRKRLERHTRAVNFVWNFCCEVQRKAEDGWRAGRPARWPSHFDLTMLCVGAGKELGIGSETMGEVCRQFVASRKAAKHCPRFRASQGSRKALGWVPFRGRFISEQDGVIRWYGQAFRFWKSREIEGQAKTGSFVQDAGGRWYVTLQCELDRHLPTGSGAIGIDLGLKTLATCSDGTAIPALQHFRRYEVALSTAQRARNHRRVKAIHAKIANARRHHLHEQSTRIAHDNKLIVVGNVSAANLKKTRMAKSVSDAGWYAFKRMLCYKASRHGAIFVEVDERFTSVTCSECGALSGPKGQKGLRIRQWKCADCGTPHDRDVNAARNILRVGLERQPPVEEIAGYAKALTCPAMKVSA